MQTMMRIIMMLMMMVMMMIMKIIMMMMMMMMMISPHECKNDEGHSVHNLQVWLPSLLEVHHACDQIILEIIIVATYL